MADLDPDFRTPNLEARGGSVGREPFVSIRSDLSTVGLSHSLRERLSVERGQYAHLKIDQLDRPWISFLSEQTDQGEPMVGSDGRSGEAIHSTLMCRHLLSLLETDELEASARFYLTRDRVVDEALGGALHRLEKPDL